MRIVAWNIRAGGGRRADDIAGDLIRWQPDAVVLSEFRGTGGSSHIAARLAAAGLVHQRNTVNRSDPPRNSLLIASHHPLRVRRDVQFAPEPRRWLRVTLAAPRRITLLGVHVPNRHTGRKYPFLDAVTEATSQWRGAPGIVLGDTNSGRRGIDEQRDTFNRIEDGWMTTLDSLGWRDAFRALHGERREYTWYSPNGGNGFRLDQAFLHPRLVRRLRAVRHDWGRDRPSDHAAVIVDLDDG